MVAGGHFENTRARQILRQALKEGAVVAMERLIGYAYEAKRVQALIETAREEGRVEACVAELGGKLLLFSAGECRGQLCRRRTASDECVRIAVEGLLRDVPDLLADARPHVYDAALAALVGLSQLTGKALRLPQAVEQALHIQREKDDAKRGSKVAKPATVGPTRAQRARKSAAAKKAWAVKKCRA